MFFGHLRRVPLPHRDVSRRNQLGALDGILVHRWPGRGDIEIAVQRGKIQTRLKVTVAPLIDCGLWGALWHNDAISRSMLARKHSWKTEGWVRRDADMAAELEMAAWDLSNSTLPNDGW